MSDLWQGNLVRLRGVEPSDWEMFDELDCDSDTAVSLYWVPLPRGKEATKQWAARKALEPPENDCYHFVIEDCEGVPVGSISTHECNRRMGTFKYGLAIRERFRGKGYAGEAIRLLLGYYFTELGYHKVIAEVYSFNNRSRRLHERLGFKLEGRLTETVRAGGAFHDELLFGLTAEEYKSLAEQWEAKHQAKGRDR